MEAVNATVLLLNVCWALPNGCFVSLSPLSRKEAFFPHFEKGGVSPPFFRLDALFPPFEERGVSSLFRERRRFFPVSRKETFLSPDMFFIFVGIGFYSFPTKRFLLSLRHCVLPPPPKIKTSIKISVQQLCRVGINYVLL